MQQNDRAVDLSQLRIERDEEEMSRRGKRRTRFWVVGSIVLVLTVLWGGSRLFNVPEVETTKVALMSPAQAATVLTAAGYIVARSKAEISPKFVGRVAWLNLEEGQKVKKGELVARLEDQELRAQRRQIAATLAQAHRDRERFRSLLEHNAVSKQAFESAETQAVSLEAQLQYIDEQIRNAEIVAPIDGVVTVKRAFHGETVAPQGYAGAGAAGATFAVIVDMDSLEMEADINEAHLGKISIGQPARLTLDAYPDRTYRARLRQIVPTADRQKGSVKVKVEIEDRDAKILPEMSARVLFLSREISSEEEGQMKIVAPSASIVEVEGNRGVLVVEGQRAQFTPLRLGEIVNTQTEVLSGVKGGETIVANAAGSPIRWRARQSVRPRNR